MEDKKINPLVLLFLEFETTPLILPQRCAEFALVLGLVVILRAPSTLSFYSTVQPVKEQYLLLKVFELVRMMMMMMKMTMALGFGSGSGSRFGDLTFFCSLTLTAVMFSKFFPSSDTPWIFSRFRLILIS